MKSLFQCILKFPRTMLLYRSWISSLYLWPIYFEALHWLHSTRSWWSKRFLVPKSGIFEMKYCVVVHGMLVYNDAFVIVHGMAVDRTIVVSYIHFQKSEQKQGKHSSFWSVMWFSPHKSLFKLERTNNPLHFLFPRSLILKFALNQTGVTSSHPSSTTVSSP